MLDFFIKNEYVRMDENGDIFRTEKCPKDIVFLEDGEGRIRFYFDYETQLVPIREPYDFEAKLIIKNIDGKDIPYTLTKDDLRCDK